MLSKAISVDVKDFRRKIKEVRYLRPPIDVLINAVDSVGDVKFIADSDGIGRRVSMLF